MNQGTMKVFERPRLVEDLLLVEGVSRAGKFLMADLLAGCKGVEHVQYCGLFEHLPYMERLGVIERDVASSILQCQIDNSAYDMMVGRNLNFRLSDKSSIYRSPHLGEYLQRSLDDNNDQILKEIRQRYYCYIVHETLPNIDLYLEAYPDLKVITIERNPIDLVYSWYKRGWGRRWGVDPLDFSMSFQGDQGPIPWFVYQICEQWETSNEMDKIILAQWQLYEMSKKALEMLPVAQRNKIFLTCYEEIVTEPMRELESIAGFLDTEILSVATNVMAREGLPNSHPKKVRDGKLRLIKEMASEQCFDLLCGLHDVYEEKGGMFK